MAGIQSIDNFTINSSSSVTFGITLGGGSDGTLNAGTYNFTLTACGIYYNWSMTTSVGAVSTLSFANITINGTDAYNFTGDYWVQQPNGTWYGSMSNTSIPFTFTNESYNGTLDTYTPPYYPLVVDQWLYDPSNNTYTRQINNCVPCTIGNIREIQKYNQLGAPHYVSNGWIFGNRSSSDTWGANGMQYPYVFDKLVSDGTPLFQIFPESQTRRAQGFYSDNYDYNDWTASNGTTVIGAKTFVSNNYSAKLSESQRYRISSYTNYSHALSNVDTIKNAIKTNGAVFLDIQPVTSTLYNFFNSSDGVLPRPDHILQYNGHAMSVIGWQIINNKQYWICNNNWGTSFGQNGICYMPIDYTGIHSYYVLVDGSTPSPNSPSSGVVLNTTIGSNGRDDGEYGGGYGKANLYTKFGDNPSGVNAVLAYSISGANSWIYQVTDSMSRSQYGYGWSSRTCSLYWLNYGTSYDLKVASLDGDTTSQPTSTYTNANTATTLPRSPSNISSSNQSSSTIDVTAVIPQDSYTGNYTSIRVTNTTTGAYIDIQGGGTAHFTGLSSATSYNFQAQTYYNINNTTLWSKFAKTATYSTNNLPSTPSTGVTLNTTYGNNGRATDNNNSYGILYLQWGSSSGATSYNLQYRINDPIQGTGTWSTITNISSTTCTLSNLNFAYTYDLQVCGVNSSGSSAYTSPNSATTLPQNVTSIDITSASTSISAIPHLTSGQYTSIRVTLLNGSTTVATQDVSNGSATNFTGLTSGITYTVQAQTYWSANGTISPSLWAYSSISQNATTNARPANWQWTTARDSNGHKILDADFSMLASEWNNFTTHINSFRTYKGMTTATFTQAASGNYFTASMFNQVLDNMVAIPTLGTGFITTHVNIGDSITASRLNNIMDSLNAIT